MVVAVFNYGQGINSGLPSREGPDLNEIRSRLGSRKSQAGGEPWPAVVVGIQESKPNFGLL